MKTFRRKIQQRVPKCFLLPLSDTPQTAKSVAQNCDLNANSNRSQFCTSRQNKRSPSQQAQNFLKPSHLTKTVYICLPLSQIPSKLLYSVHPFKRQMRWLSEKVEITTVPVVSPDSLTENAIALCLLMSSSTYLMSLCEHPPFSHRSGAINATLFPVS